MPFNNQGLFNRIYDWKRDRDNGVNILAERMDSETNSIVAAINAILQGRFKFLGTIKNLFGTQSRPSVTFDEDEDTGIYRVRENTLGITAGGVKKIEVGNDNTKILGNLEVSWENVNDGANSNLDADKLDGEEGSFYQNAGNIMTGTLGSDRLSGNYNITANNATNLNGKAESFYRNAGHINDGTLDSNRLSGSYNITASNATNAHNATRLNGLAASDYLNASNIRTGSLPYRQLSGTYNIDVNGDIVASRGRIGRNTLRTTNLDTLSYNGWYYAENTATGTPPAEGTFIFESMFSDTNNGRQRGYYKENGIEYQRQKINSVWGDWERIYTRTAAPIIPEVYRPNVVHQTMSAVKVVSFPRSIAGYHGYYGETHVPNLKARITTSRPNAKVKIEINISVGASRGCGVFIKRKYNNGAYTDIRPNVGELKVYRVINSSIAVNNESIIEINTTGNAGQYEYSVWMCGYSTSSSYINRSHDNNAFFTASSSITLSEI